MKKHLKSILTFIAFCIVFTTAQTLYAQKPLPTPETPNFPDPSKRAVIGTISAVNGTDLQKLAAAYQCSDITVVMGIFSIIDSGTILGMAGSFQTVQSGKVFGDIKDGTCAYAIPYDSKVPVRKYEMRFSAPSKYPKQNDSGCLTTRKLDISSPKADYPKNGENAVKVNGTFSFVCSKL